MGTFQALHGPAEFLAETASFASPGQPSSRSDSMHQEAGDVGAVVTAASGAQSQSGQSRGEESQDAWLQRVSTSVQSRLAPEARRSLLERAAAVQRREQSSFRAHQIQQANTSIGNAWSSAMRSAVTYSAPPSRPLSAPFPMDDAVRAQQLSSIAQSSAAQMRQASRSVMALPPPQSTSSRIPPMPAPPAPGTRSHRDMLGDGAGVPVLEAGSHRLEEETHGLTGTVVGVLSAGRRQEVVPETTEGEMRTLLNELRTEPASDAEVKAKFVMFEAYLESVEVVRKELFTLWEETKEQFGVEGHMARRGMEKRLRALDDQGNMGVDFVEGRWFVYDMTLKASQNSQLIGRLVAEIKTKLELLGANEECPVCMESYSDDQGRPAVVLTCCHKVCRVCWEHWSVLNHGRPFCPLCRYDDFATEILSRRSRIP